MADRIKSFLCFLAAVVLLGGVGFWGCATAQSTAVFEKAAVALWEKVEKLLPDK